MSKVVDEALRKMKARRWDRGTGDLYGGNRQEEVAALRANMFQRRETGEAFHPLSPRELAMLESVVDGHETFNKFRVVAGEGSPLDADYALIRHNHISGQKIVTPNEFRVAANRITESLMEFVKGEYGITVLTAIVLPWRAALAFAEPALQAGIRDFYHLGARRNERTLETEVYSEEVSPRFQGSLVLGRQAGIVADPMLATGNTAIVGISRLLSLGVAEDNIIVVAVISAPEGVDQIFERFPTVKIIAGQHDECLNDRGYIFPGLGDFGDLYFDGLQTEVAQRWRDRGILSGAAYSALIQRMNAATGNVA